MFSIYSTITKQKIIKQSIHEPGFRQCTRNSEPDQNLVEALYKLTISKCHRVFSMLLASLTIVCVSRCKYCTLSSLYKGHFTVLDKLIETKDSPNISCLE